MELKQLRRSGRYGRYTYDGIGIMDIPYDIDETEPEIEVTFVAWSELDAEPPDVDVLRVIQLSPDGDRREIVVSDELRSIIEAAAADAIVQHEIDAWHIAKGRKDGV